MLSRLILIVGALLIVFMGLFPPWHYTYKWYDDRNVFVQQRSAGYSFILFPPVPEPEKWKTLTSVSIESRSLAAEMATVVLACGLLAFGLRSKPPRQNDSSESAPDEQHPQQTKSQEPIAAESDTKSMKLSDEELNRSSREALKHLNHPVQKRANELWAKERSKQSHSATDATDEDASNNNA